MSIDHWTVLVFSSGVIKESQGLLTHGLDVFIAVLTVAFTQTAKCVPVCVL